MSKKKINLTIAGKPYNLQCEANKVSDLEVAANTLDGKIQHIKQLGVIGPERVAVLAALELLVENA